MNRRARPSCDIHEHLGTRASWHLRKRNQVRINADRRCLLTDRAWLSGIEERDALRTPIVSSRESWPGVETTCGAIRRTASGTGRIGVPTSESGSRPLTILRIRMRRFIVAVSLLLIAATPSDAAPELEDKGYYIEPGSAASEQVVSDAVFEGRSDGGRLYLVVLSEEPPGGATTFSDSVLDLLGAGYVVTVAPETVGFAGDGSFWNADEMNAAIDASLSGGSDNQVVELFIADLIDTSTLQPSDVGEEAADPGDSGISGWVWLLLIGGGAALAFRMLNGSHRRATERMAAELETVRAMARDKLAEIANDIIEMEDEVDLSEDPEVKAHYQRASATYTEALALTQSIQAPREMIEVIRELDLAIWELDSAEALLDGKPIPEKPKPPEPEPVAATRQDTPSDITYRRRPQRRSSYAGNDLMTALMAILAMSGRGGGRWGGMPGGFGGPMRTGSRGPRSSGGGMRGRGFGRMRGGGRRRG